MDKQEAKIILEGYCPRPGEAPEPAVAEALRMMEADSELRAWYDETRAVDAAIRRKLRAAPPPDDLSAEIIESLRSGEKYSSRRRWVLPLALAATIALLLAVAALLSERNPSKNRDAAAAFAADMAVFLKEFPKLDLYTEKPSEALAWLQTNAPANVELPVALSRFPTIGCREIQWQNTKAALVCFMVDGEVVHVFVLSRAQLASLNGTGQQPRFGKAGRFRTASWSRGDAVLVALTPAGESFLRKHLSAPGASG